MGASLWMVGESDWDSFTPHAVFISGEDAAAYASVIGEHPYELPLYQPGTQPTIVEAWSAQAEVRRRPTTATVSHGGRSTTTRYDNEPPKLELHRFSTLGTVPEWAQQPCEVTNCEMTLDGMYIRFHGSDRDAVLEACRQRYEAGLDAMGARR